MLRRGKTLPQRAFNILGIGDADSLRAAGPRDFREVGALEGGAVGVAVDVGLLHERLAESAVIVDDHENIRAVLCGGR